MENIGIINQIKSSYIIKNIFKYIEDDTVQLKLFIHSKYLQQKLNIKLINYQEKYLTKIGFDLDKYLYIPQDDFQIDILKKQYNNFLLENNLNKEEYDNIISEILKNKSTKDIDDEEEDDNKKNKCESLIYIDSPFFEVISNTKMLEKKYTLFISQEIIDNNNLYYDYKKCFNKLNKENIKYTSIYYKFNDKDKIKYLKEFNIDFNKIKRMTLIHNDIDGREEDAAKNVVNQMNKNFFDNLFSFSNIENNLIYLKIKINSQYRLAPNLFENINNFKALKYLYINSFFFDSDFIIKLNNIKLLYIENSDNIGIYQPSCQKLEVLNLSSFRMSNMSFLENENFKKLKELKLLDNNISDINILKNVKFDQLEKLYLGYNQISNNIDILENVNFKELKELNLYYNNIPDIQVLEKVRFEKLEILNLGCNKIFNIDILENANFKELKELYLNNNNISSINVLGKVKFQKLKILNLGCNEISNINILVNVNFHHLKELYLNYNKISNIEVLELVNFKKLEILDLGKNEISNINILEYVDFKELEVLILYDNKISDIKVFEKIKFQKLDKLDLRNNKISNKRYAFENTNFPKLKQLYMK